MERERSHLGRAHTYIMDARLCVCVCVRVSEFVYVCVIE